MSEKTYVFVDPDGTEEIGLSLVIEALTGVEYGNQCGGSATEENAVEGYLIPLGMRDMEQRLYDFFWDEFGGHCHKPRNEWTERRILKLEELIRQIPDWICSKKNKDERASLELDRTRIADCIEAWIPVRSKRGKGILMLKNSD